MRKLIWPFAFLFLLFTPRHTNAVVPTLEQFCTNASFGGQLASCTLPGPVATNHMIALLVTSCGPTLPSQMPNDTLGLAYQISGATILTFSTTCNFRNHELLIFFACTGAASGIDTIFQSGAGPVAYSPGIITAEFSGVTCAQDGLPVANGLLGGMPGSQSGGSLATSLTNDLLVAASLASGNPSSIPTVGSGYTLVASLVVDWGGNDCGGPCTAYIVMQYKVAPTAGSYPTDFVFGANNNAGAIGAAFGPGGTPSATRVPHKVKEIRGKPRRRFGLTVTGK